MLHEASDWKGLQEYIALLSKRRGQLKQAVQAMVRQCMGYTAAAPADIKVEFIKTLQAITEGKVGASACVWRGCIFMQQAMDFSTWFEAPL